MKGASQAILFQADTGTGLPRLLDPNQRLTPDEFVQMEEEVRRRFEELVGSTPEKVFHLPSASATARAYRVTVRRARGERCPTLELVPEGNGAANEKKDGRQPSPATVRWWRLFGQELERVQGMATADESATLAFVIDDLRAIMAKKPESLLPLLLAGFLRLGDGLCRSHGPDAENAYVHCAPILMRLFADVLPQGALDELLARRQSSSS